MSEYWTISEAATLLGITPQTIRMHLRRKPELKNLCEMRGGNWILSPAAMAMLKSRPGYGRPVLKKVEKATSKK